MNTHRACAVAMAVLLGVGAAGPGISSAETPLYGTFALTTTPPSVWTIATTCLPNCVARVRSSAGWSSFATLETATWTLSVYLGNWPRSSYPVDPASCVTTGPDAPISQNFSFDAGTLAGSVETVRGDQCGGPTRIDRQAFSLNKFD